MTTTRNKPDSTLSNMLRACKTERVSKRQPEIKDFDYFFKYYPPAADYIYGKHTIALINILNSVTKSVESGTSRYVMVNMPFRHGKSDIVSRRYPAWHLMRNPDHEIIVCSYNYSMASDLSYDLRAWIVKYGHLYGIYVKDDRSAIGAWRINNRKGVVYAVGLGGTISGRGGNVIIIDDYHKNREEADSVIMRDKVMHTFQSDLITRVAPVHAVLIVANRWHEDDMCGRIINKNNASHQDYDPYFPKFERVTFPAFDDTSKEWLFPERLSPEWYLSVRAGMSEYAWNAQAQQEPIPRIGNLLRADLVTIIDSNKVPDGLQWRRGWDIASTEKDLVKDDPDYTVGTLAAYDKRTKKLYIKDVVAGRWSTLRRDEKIIQTADRDGNAVQVRVEGVGGYVDTFNRIRSMLRGKTIVRKVSPDRDKVSRAGYLEGPFEAGNVYVVRGGEMSWFPSWREEFISFPSGRHDDKVDSLLVAVMDDIRGAGGGVSF